MIPVRVLALTGRTVQTRVRLLPSEAGGVQAVSDRPIVRLRHSRQPLRTNPHWIDLRTVGVPHVAKEIE